MTANCICGSGKLFQNCCGRFLDGDEHAKTAEQLMRSRFSAYSLGGYGDYLLATWQNSHALGLSSEQLSESEADWYKLEVLSKSQQGDNAIVEFIAYFRDSEGDHTLHERSSFQRTNGRWLYVSGEIL